MNQAITREDGLAAEQRYWLADNPGILTRIAREVGATQPFVSDVFYGRRPGQTGKGLMIREKLAGYGAPGFATKAA